MCVFAPIDMNRLRPSHDARFMYFVQEVGTKQLGGVEIACLEMGEVPKDRVRAPFLAVGDWNGNVKILGLNPENLLEQVCVLFLRRVVLLH